jgi:hypothetical protein
MKKQTQIAKDTPSKEAKTSTLQDAAGSHKTGRKRPNAAIPDSEKIKKLVAKKRETTTARLSTKQLFGVDDKTLKKIITPVCPARPDLINMSTLETLSEHLSHPVRDITKKPTEQAVPQNHEYYSTLRHSAYVDYNRHSIGSQFLSWWPQEVEITQLNKTLEELPGALFRVRITNSHKIEYQGLGILSGHSGFTMITARSSQEEGADAEAPTLTFTQALKTAADCTILVGTWCGTDSSGRNARIFRVVLSPEPITNEQIRLIAVHSVVICDGDDCRLETYADPETAGRNP